MQSKILRILFLIPIVIALSHTLNAQSTSGTVFGSVLDSTGAAIPGASVTLADVQTGATTTAVSDAKGNFTYAIVNPGDYTVTVSATGFKTVSQVGIILAANQNIRVPFNLAVGNASESVSVEAGVTLVDTREAQLGTTIEQSKIEDLPTLNRDVYSLLTTTPGVTNYAADSNIGTRAGVRLSVNGLSTDQVSYYLDGSYDEALNDNGGNKIPNPDALSEFRILTSNFDAEFGRSPAAVVNAITRSGTDMYHGAAYDYFRNNILDARDYFVAPTSAANPAIQLQQNQFGGRVGGPVKVLSKLFFFLDYQGTILRTQDVINAGTVQTPSAAERMGSFAGDTFGTKGTFRVPKLPPGANCGTAAAPVICNGSNYKGGPLGSARNFLDPVAQALLAYVPVGAPGTHLIGQQVAKADSFSNEGLSRFDYSGFKNHSIEAMFYYTKGNDSDPAAGNNQIFGYGGAVDAEQQFNIVAADIWTLSDRTVNSFRAFESRNHYTIFNLNNIYAQDLGSLLRPGGAIYAPSLFNLQTYANIGGTAHGPANLNQVQYGGIDTLSVTRGAHSLKLGGSYVYDNLLNQNATSAGGNFAFTGSRTGNTFADFLIGSANTLNQNNVNDHKVYSYDPSIYAQDDWQTTRRLSLNLGLRWEVFAPYFGDSTLGSFAPGIQSLVIPSAPIGLLYQGDKGVPQGVFNTSYKDFAPRVGFALDAFGDGKTGLRGGFGVFYMEQNAANTTGQSQAPIGLVTVTNQTPNLVCPYGGTVPPCPTGTPAGTDPYPYNSTTLTFPNPASGASIQAAPRNGGATPYVYEYNLTLEQQLGSSFAMHVAYVGNNLHKEYITIDANSPIYSPDASVGAAGILARRPYEPYGVGATSRFRYGAINFNEPAENGSYNSLQATLQGRIGRKLSMFASYVWSKSLNYAGPTVDSYDLSLNYGAADTDLRHRFVVSYLYELPTTRHLGAFGQEAINGWHINGITSLQSGTPFTIVSGVDTNFDGMNNDRVNVIGNANLGHLSRAQKILHGTVNPAALSIPTGPYGNEQRNQFHGPAYIDTDLSIYKEFPLIQRVRFQFRAEAFNALGNVNLLTSRTSYSSIDTAGLPQITNAGPPRRIQFAAKILF